MKRFLRFLALVALMYIPWVTLAQVSLPYSYGFEDNDLSVDGWTTQNPSGLDDSDLGISSDAYRTGSYGFRFSSYNESGVHTQYLISQEFEGDSMVLSFWCAKSTSNAEYLSVGYSSTTRDTSAFTWGDWFEPTLSWSQFSQAMPAGTSTTPPVAPILAS